MTPGASQNFPNSKAPAFRSRLVLASASPRRRDILDKAGYIFECEDPGEVENAIVAAPTPEALAIAKARAKAMEVAARIRPPLPALVVGVDTLVALGDEVIGKPLDRLDAVSILSRLSRARHRVISGVCLLWIGELGTLAAPLLDSASTWVTMRAMSLAEIEAYVATGQSDGKAGAYAIQESGDQFVKELDGSLLNVVGMPLELFERLLPTLTLP